MHAHIIHNNHDHIIIGPSTSTANQETVTIAVSSSITMSILSSVVFFVFGYICGCKCKKTSRRTGDIVSSGTKVTQQHVQAEGREQDIELNENLAYDPIYEDILT